MCVLYNRSTPRWKLEREQTDGCSWTSHLSSQRLWRCQLPVWESRRLWAVRFSGRRFCPAAGTHENMKSIEPRENMSLLCSNSVRTGSTKGFPPSPGGMLRLGTAGGFTVVHRCNSSNIDFRLRETKARLSLLMAGRNPNCGQRKHLPSCCCWKNSLLFKPFSCVHAGVSNQMHIYLGYICAC